MKRTVSLLVGLSILSWACAPLVRRSVDRPLAVTVVVRDQGGTPVSDARVALNFLHHARERTDERTTDKTGGCIFSYISGGPRVPFSLTVNKEGYVPHSESGVAAPYAHLKVTLIREAESKNVSDGKQVNRHSNRLQRTIGADVIRRAPLAAEPER